jgi:hypothetical protein
MAQKLGFFRQMLGGDHAERHAINANADALESIESRVDVLHETVFQQQKEILQLRATLMGLAELLQSKVPYEDAELESRVRTAWDELAPPKAARKAAVDPYRDTPVTGDPTPAETDAAKQLLKVAEGHHFAKRFAEAKVAYQEVITKYASTKQASTARQQLDNLRSS